VQQVEDGISDCSVDHALVHLDEMIRLRQQPNHCNEDWQCNYGPFGALTTERYENELFALPQTPKYYPQDDSSLDHESDETQHLVDTSNWDNTCTPSLADQASGEFSDRYSCISESASPLLQQTSFSQSTVAASMPGLTTYSLSHGSPYLPHDVRFLMSHYTELVIDSLASLPHPKAPWKGLHVPCALSAFVELDFFGRSNLARVSVLYSLLSLASFHLSALYESGTTTSYLDSASLIRVGESSTNDHALHWISQARKYREIARIAYHKCAQQILKEGKSSVKYKEMLMAAMNLVCIGVNYIRPFR
jgi:hypothetical protein